MSVAILVLCSHRVLFEWQLNIVISWKFKSICRAVAPCRNPNTSFSMMFLVLTLPWWIVSANSSEKLHHHPSRCRVIQAVYTPQVCNIKSCNDYQLKKIMYYATAKNFVTQKLSDQIAGVFQYIEELFNFHPGKDNYRHVLNETQYAAVSLNSSTHSL